MNVRLNRKSAIVSIINSKRIHTQEELLSALQERGISTTQATLSRDIKEIGAVKVSDSHHGFYYRIPARVDGSRSLPISDIEVSGQLCVIHSNPGFASAVASLLDVAALDGVMGTLAGDDTVLLILREKVDGQKLIDTIKSIL